MGWAYGENNNGREIGYGVKAVCDLPGCENTIDHGVGYCCGGLDGTANAGMDEEAYCGDFFCDKHLFFLYSQQDDSLMVCPTCYDKQKCPDCKGTARLPSGEPCETCDTFGHVRHQWSDEAGAMVPV